MRSEAECSCLGLPNSEAPEAATPCHVRSPHLSADPGTFSPLPLVGPDNSAEPPPEWFMAAVHELNGLETAVLSAPPFRFDTSKEAIEFNAKLLEEFDLDLGKLIEAHRGSTLDYGSEFRSVRELTPLLGRHPNFATLAEYMTNGMPYLFSREIDPATKLDELETLIRRGNHKSAQDETDQVVLLLGKDVRGHGFSVPLPVRLVPAISGAAVQPLGLAKQWGVMPDGSRTAKFRLTQDLSFSSNKVGPPRAINARVDMDMYPEMTYGWCLPRKLHYMISLQTYCPGTVTLISKYDYSDAYRRMAHSAEAAKQTIAVVGLVAYLSLRLAYGGSPNPPAWCSFSEMETDLSNELAKCRMWDPEVTFSPAQPIAPKPELLPSKIPVETARKMSVLAPVTDGGMVDGFIDDLISVVFLDSPRNRIRHTQAVPLAMHLTSCPHAGEGREPLSRREILSQAQLKAEGSPAEVQVVLGCWRIETRRLLISLPEDKFQAWSFDVARIRGTVGRCLRTDVEFLVGRLNHTAGVIPQSRHFLVRIRQALGPNDGKRRRYSTLNHEVREDLQLWERFLEKAAAGIPINILVTREPDVVCWSDACPYGIGGYGLTGRAWRIRIPKGSPIYGSKRVNNLLEFIGMAVNIWLACLDPNSSQNCILAIGDNMSAIG